MCREGEEINVKGGKKRKKLGSQGRLMALDTQLFSSVPQ